MVDIDRSVKAYYEQTELSEEQLQRLVAMQQTEDAKEKSNAANLWLRRASLMAAAVVVTVLVFVFNGGDHIDDLAQRVAQEVAMNHNKALAVEYQADSYDALSKSMDKLDFTLRAPTSGLNDGLALIGGRYCSIQGELAAQIKMVDEAGQIYTLYQARSNDELRVVNAGRIQSDQVNIRLWQDQGLLFALAGAVE